MKSKTSFFNKAVFTNPQKRIWPLWCLYFAFLFLTVDAPFLRVNDPSGRRLAQLAGESILGNLSSEIFVGAAGACLVALLVFSYLYQTRSAGMMASLPVSRSSMFITSYLSGLLPVLACQLLAYLAALLLEASNGLIVISVLNTWLFCSACAFVFFYSFAVFCAMLTGSVAIMPLVYLVFNIVVPVVEYCIRVILEAMVYGFFSNGVSLKFLSPIVYILNGDVTVGENSKIIWDNGVSVLRVAEYTADTAIYIYGIVGIAFAYIALHLYRRRRMESATDTVAILSLKPIFKYCMSAGTGIVLGDLVKEIVFGSSGYTGPAGGIVIGVMMVIGAVVGYFAAEMILRKSFKVITVSRREGMILICAFFIVFTAIAETGLLGYETRVPDAKDVESVYVVNGTVIRSPENIEKVTALHKNIIRDKKLNEKANSVYTVYITYTLKNGREITRCYGLDDGSQAEAEPGSNANELENIYNLPEAILSRNNIPADFSQSDMRASEIYIQEYNEDLGHYVGRDIALSEDEAYELLTEAIIPDMNDGNIGKVFVFYSNRGVKHETNVSLNFQLRTDRITEQNNVVNAPVPAVYSSSEYGAEYWKYYGFSVAPESERTLNWLEKHYGFDIITCDEMNKYEPDKGVYLG